MLRSSLFFCSSVLVSLSQMESQENRQKEEEDVASVHSSTSSDSQKHTYSISQTLYDTLLQKGFSENAIKKSIVAGCIDEGTCTQWITMHEGHPELDTPLEDGVIVTIKAKRVLTEAEREAKVKELQDKIKAKKEAEKLSAHQKELERIENGRKALETKAKLDAIRREMDLKEVRQQKVAEAEARRRIKIQIVADRYTRQGMHAEEAWEKAEEEYEEGQRKLREEAAAKLSAMTESSSRGSASAAGGASGKEWNLAAAVGAAAPSSSAGLQRQFDATPPTLAETESLSQRLCALPDVAAREQCIQTLRTILTNARDHPFDVKKRTLKVSTKALSQRVLPHNDAVQLLRLCNFDLSTDTEGTQVLTCTTLVIRQLNTVLRALDRAASAAVAPAPS